jgi:hypothetical protein
MNRDGSRQGEFTEREMRLIFERAGQAGAATEGDRRYSLTELQDIASQAGLDANDVARAAATIRGTPAGNPVFGAPVRFRSARTVRELSEDEILSAVLRLRAATGLHGELRAVPGGIEWHAQSAMGKIIIDFARANTGTRVDVLVARDDQAMVTVMGAATVGLVAGIIAGINVASYAGGAGAAGVGIVAGVGSAWLATRLLWSRIARRWAREADVLTQTASEAADPEPHEPKRP